MAKILVVDDEPRNLRFAMAVIEQTGHQALGANDAATAIALALAEQPALVLMDVQMPGMNGIEALKRLRADAFTFRLKVLAFTALAMKGDRERLLAEGFDGYLEKPIRYRAFLDALRTFVGEAPGHG